MVASSMYGSSALYAYGRSGSLYSSILTPPIYGKRTRPIHLTVSTKRRFHCPVLWFFNSRDCNICVNSHIYGELNSHWKAVCRVIFGQEVGEFRDFEPWLAQGARPLFKAKSSLSGKEVSFILPPSPPNARAVSLSEIHFAKVFEPLNINRIKDLDSIVEAL